MADVIVTKQERRYVATIEGIDAEAELTFRPGAPGTIVAVHTGVPDAFRGKGVGRVLVTRLVEDARKEGFKIVPACSFVDAERRKHPEWADAFVG
jgi:predicted GNAT family acetyltransferase